MPTAIDERDQRFEQEPAHDSRYSFVALRARARASRRPSLAAVAGCATVRHRRRRPPSHRRRRPRRRAVAAARAIAPVAFGRAARLERRPRARTRGPRFASAARRSSHPTRPRALWHARRAPPPTRSTPSDAPAVRAFFEAHFSPYRGRRRRRPRRRASSPATTSRCSPAAATRTARFACRCTRAPDDLLTIDLTELYPGAQGQAAARPRRGHAVVPYWSRADIERGTAPLAGKALVYVDDPVEAFFLQIQGSGRVRARRRQRHARRLRRPERPSVPLDRRAC